MGKYEKMENIMDRVDILSMTINRKKDIGYSFGGELVDEELELLESELSELSRLYFET